MLLYYVTLLSFFSSCVNNFWKWAFWEKIFFLEIDHIPYKKNRESRIPDIKTYRLYRHGHGQKKKNFVCAVSSVLCKGTSFKHYVSRCKETWAGSGWRREGRFNGDRSLGGGGYVGHFPPSPSSNRLSFARNAHKNRWLGLWSRPICRARSRHPPMTKL